MVQRIGGTHRYSDIVIHDNIAYLSGVVASDLSGSTYEQTAEVLSTIDRLLLTAGTTKNNILSMTIYLTDASEYDEMNRAFDKWIANNNAPARATICNVRFPNALWKIEITLSAIVPKIHSREPIYNNLNYIR
jgi:enamine deaminase RidA (YjgF/YER057c/UK114 family)